jgi:hypothetical protein
MFGVYPKNSFSIQQKKVLQTPLLWTGGVYELPLSTAIADTVCAYIITSVADPASNNMTEHTMQLNPAMTFLAPFINMYIAIPTRIALVAPRVVATP